VSYARAFIQDENNLSEDDYEEVGGAGEDDIIVQDQQREGDDEDDTSSISFGSNEESKMFDGVIVDEEESIKTLNHLTSSQLDEELRDQPDTDFSIWDFHPDEPNPPATQTFCTYIESLRNTLNSLMKKRMKEPILQNTRKLILTATKADNTSYDEEFN
jgi:cytoskeletal protein RodZ